MDGIDTLEAVSAIDGRYHSATRELSPFFSEAALIEYRLQVMVRWVIALTESSELPIRALSADERSYLTQLASPDIQQVRRVKLIEIEKTNHDVKACEIYLRECFEVTTLRDLVEWIHFACTSEDVNNVAYALMLQDGLNACIFPAIDGIRVQLQNMASAYANIPMLARTHGQAASPTTLGKEFAVFASRLVNQFDQLKCHVLTVKMNGASGNYNAHVVAFPDVDWEWFTKEFIMSFNNDTGIRLVQNRLTTQIEPHDTYAELFDIMKRINNVLVNLSQDTWRYVSDYWLAQHRAKGETGSSTMPHKVNPIDLENGEGNLEQAIALLEFFSRKLTRSRLQRDLSDSTVERSFGTAFAWCLIGYKAILKGLRKVAPNEEAIRAGLDAHWEVVTEAYQTILRTEGFPDAYMKLKDLSRGEKITQGKLFEFVAGLDASPEVKRRLLALSPHNYTGLAAKLATSF